MRKKIENVALVIPPTETATETATETIETTKPIKRVKPQTRRKLYFENLSKGMTKKAAALKAGYSKYTALEASRIENTLAAQNEILKITETPEGKKLIADDGVILEQIRSILTQNREQSTKLKLITMLLRQKGLELEPQENRNTQIPVINILVDQR